MKTHITLDDKVLEQLEHYATMYRTNKSPVTRYKIEQAVTSYIQENVPRWQTQKRGLYREYYQRKTRCNS